MAAKSGRYTNGPISISVFIIRNNIANLPTDPTLLRKEGFKCDESLEYIPQQFVCDKYRDCEGRGEDETDEACANKCKLVSFFSIFLLLPIFT